MNTTPVGGNVRDVEIGRRSVYPALSAFYGAIDDVRIYSRALTSLELAGLADCSANMRWPLEGTPAERSVTSRFGDDWEKPCGGLIKKHVGIDLQAAAGEPVFSPIDGVVRAVMNDDEWGQGITIERSAGGCTTVLWHVQAGVSPGDCVAQGEPIATVQDRAADTHLHFGIRGAAYDNISNHGGLPQMLCEGDPPFPEHFVDPDTVDFDLETIFRDGFECGDQSKWSTSSP